MYFILGYNMSLIRAILGISEDKFNETIKAYILRMMHEHKYDVPTIS
jgi:hypothetical protein